MNDVSQSLPRPTLVNIAGTFVEFNQKLIEVVDAVVVIIIAAAAAALVIILNYLTWRRMHSHERFLVRPYYLL